MRRRAFIAALGGAAAWPVCGARATGCFASGRLSQYSISGATDEPWEHTEAGTQGCPPNGNLYRRRSVTRLTPPDEDSI